MYISPLKNSPHFALVSRYSPKLIEVCRTVPGLRFDRGVGAWLGYPDAIAALARALKKAGLQSFDTSALPKPHKYRAPFIPIAEKGLLEHQKTGVSFILDRGRWGCILADEMGLMKSRQSIVAARALKAKTVVVCPSHVRGVWARQGDGKGTLKGELQKWWPKARVCTPEGINPHTPISWVSNGSLTADDGSAGGKLIPLKTAVLRQDGALRAPSVLDDYDVVVIHYDIIHAWADTLIAWGFKTLILDETNSALVRFQSRRSRAIRKLVAHARVKVALDGTPPDEYPRDFWNLADTLSPGRFGPFFNYGLSFCGGHQEEVTKDKIVWKFDGRSNLDELARRTKYFVLRRTRQDVNLALPPMTRQVIDIDVPKKHQHSLRSTMNKRAVREALNLAANGKLPTVIERVRKRIREGHSVILFTWRRSLAEYLAAELAKPPKKGERAGDVTHLDFPIKTFVIHGGVPKKVRMARQDAARLQPRSVLCCTMATVETGLDFSYASAGIFAELTWKAKVLAQCEKRLDRFGQKRAVEIEYVVARGTGDEFVLAGVLKKLDTFEAVFGETGDGLRKTLGAEKEDGFAALAKRLREQEAREERRWLKATKKSRAKAA
jgi:SNF2 family DNA or RNA helicase